jgi:hypothetical protein
MLNMLGAAVGLQLRRGHEGEVTLDAVEGRVHLLEVEEVRRRQRIARQVLLRVEAPDVHEAGIISIGQRLQQHAVDDGEDRGGGADAERQREHGQRREDGCLHRKPQRVTNVRAQSVPQHEVAPGRFVEMRSEIGKVGPAPDRRAALGESVGHVLHDDPGRAVP